MSALTAMLGPAAGTAEAAAAGRSDASAVSFLRRDYDLQIQPNGDVAVAERWQVHFSGGPYTSATVGVFLTDTQSVDFQPIAGADPNSERVARVADAQGHPIEEISWTFPAAHDETRAFTIPYTLRAAIGQNSTQAWLDAHLFDGPGRGAFSVAASQVTVTLPGAAKGDGAQVRSAYSGAQLQTSRPSDTTAVVQGQNLNSGQLLEVAVIFPRSLLGSSAAKPAWQRGDTPPNPPTPLEVDASATTATDPGSGGPGGLVSNVGFVLAVGLVILAGLAFLAWRLSRRLSSDIQELAAIKAGDGAAGAEAAADAAAITAQLPAIDLDFGVVEWPTRDEPLDLSALGLQPLESGPRNADDAPEARDEAGTGGAISGVGESEGA